MRWLECKLKKATRCLLTHSQTLNRFKKHKLITYLHPPIPIIIPMIMVLIRASPISKLGAQHDHFIQPTNCQRNMGRRARLPDFWALSFLFQLYVWHWRPQHKGVLCGKHSTHFTPIKKREWFHCNRVGIELRTSERLSELLRRTELCKSYCFSK